MQGFSFDYTTKVKRKFVPSLNPDRSPHPQAIGSLQAQFTPLGSCAC